MRLEEYPRPPDDNGRGIHWSTSQYAWGKKDWEMWANRLLDMKIKWVTAIIAPDDNAIELSMRLIDLGIMPVVRFMGSGLEPKIAGGAIFDMMHRLVSEVGVSYFQLKNENDARVEREGGEKAPDWEVDDAENIMIEIQKTNEAGGIYVVYAYNSGSLEPRQFPEIIVDLGGKDLLNTAALCIHNYGKGRPPEYPNDHVRMFGTPLTLNEMYREQGQPDWWEASQIQEWIWKGQGIMGINGKRDAQKDPGITIHQDFTAFRMFEYWMWQYESMGLDLPLIIGGESGWEINDVVDDFYPNPTDVKHAEYTRKAMEFIQGSMPLNLLDSEGKPYEFYVPDHVATMTYWNAGEAAFGSDTSGQWETGAWYTKLHDELFDLDGNITAVDMMVNTPDAIRHPGNVPLIWDARKHLFPPENIDYWDSRLVYVGAKIIPPPMYPKYEIRKGVWQDSTDEGIYPRGYIMVMVKDEFGIPITGARVAVARTGENGQTVIDHIETKAEVDGFLGNYYMTAPKPVYVVYVDIDGEPSDGITNLGLGRESGGEWDGTSYYFEFRYTKGAEAQPVTPS